jgi:phosphoesterase RecJ-like protein
MIKSRTISPEIDDILKLMRGKDRFLITSHKDPDGDSIGSQLGLYRVLVNTGKKAQIVNQGGLPEKYTFLDPRGFISFDNSALKFEPEVVFVLECPTLDRIGDVQKIIPPSASIINIDHHRDNRNYADINLVDIGRCAVGELLFDIIDTGKYEVTPEIAEDLYAAVVCDTGNFRFASTTSKGMKIAAELIDRGVNPKKIFDHIFSKFAPGTLRLLGLTLASLQVTDSGLISYMQVTLDNVSKARARMEDSEGFVDYCLTVNGVRMGILFKEVENNEVKISVRSQNGIDASGFAKGFDGGGHINAAGFTLKGLLPDVVERVLTKATEYVHGK